MIRETFYVFLLSEHKLSMRRQSKTVNQLSRLIYIIYHSDNKHYINRHPKHVDSKLLISTFSLTTPTHEYHIFRP